VIIVVTYCSDNFEYLFITPSYTGQYNERQQEGISVYQVLGQYRPTYSIQQDRNAH